MDIASPVPGPWNNFRPLIVAQLSSQPVVVPQVYPPPFQGGPLRIGPWLRNPHPVPPIMPPPAPPSPPPSVTDLPYIDRDAGNQTNVERLRRATQKISTILNSLIRQRILVMTGDVDWTLDVEGGGILDATMKH